MKKSHHHTPSSLRGQSPAMRASVALNVTLKEDIDGTEVSVLPIEAPRSRPTSGFTAVNATGFTAVNAASATFTAVNASNPTAHYDSENGASTPRRSAESPMTSSKNTPEYRPSNLGTASLTNGHTSNHLKRRLSPESINGGSQTDSGTPNGDCDSNSGRRSKRLKKGTYNLVTPPALLGVILLAITPSMESSPQSIDGLRFHSANSGCRGASHSCGIAYELTTSCNAKNTGGSRKWQTWRGKSLFTILRVNDI